MFKKVMCLILCFAMIASVVAFTACGEYEAEVTDSRLPTTLSLLGITEASTKPEDVKRVEDAINKITKARYETAIDLTLVTLDEYEELINAKVKEAEYYTNVDKAIKNYNSYVKNQAENSAASLQSSNNSKKKWVKSIQTVAAATIATRSLYTAEQTTVYEDGTIETVYPDAASPIDIVMITGRDMYDRFDENGVLISLDNYVATTYKKLRQYIYPSFFDELKNITGDIKAIPNNNLLANYKYLVVNKELADKYEFNIDLVKDYNDLSDFLAAVKAGESGIVPFSEKPDALGIFYAFSEDIAIGSYFDPLLGYDVEAGTSFTTSNLFDIPQYRTYLSTMESFENNGYFGNGTEENWAVKVIVGDASVEATFGLDEGDYYTKVIQNPFIEEDILFRGMMGVSNYSSNPDRAMEIILMINTDSDVKNLLQYGIEGINYSVNNDGTIVRLNHDYMMDNNMTGNVYMGYPEEGVSADAWKYVKATNLDSSPSPFLIYDITDSKIDALLDTIITRAVMDEALAPIGVDYDAYLDAVGTADFTNYQLAFRNQFKDFFTERLRSAGVLEASISSVLANVKHTVYTPEWYIKQYVDYVKAMKYSAISTNSGIDSLIKAEIASVVGVPYSIAENKTNSFEYYRNQAKDYYTNIEYLRIMTKLTVFADMSEEELARYDRMSGADFEQAVFEYVKQNYIKENDLDDESYDKLVKDFIAKDLSFVDNLTKQTYTISWELYQETKNNSKVFREAADKLKSKYADLLSSKYSQKQLDSMDALTIADEVHALLYSRYLSENGLTKSKFEASLKEEIAGVAGVTYDDMMAKKSDTATYDSYINKIRSKYKSVLVDAYSLDEYKMGKDAISNDAVMTTVLNHLIEKETGIYDEMYDAMGLSKSEYAESRIEMENFKKYAGKMRDNSYYTLATEYSSAQISGFTLEEVDTVVYDIMHRTGFYTNIMAEYVGKQLSGSTGYMIAKSKSVNYTNCMNLLISRYGQQFVAAGYSMDEIRSMNPEDVEDILYDVLQEKYVAQFAKLEDILEKSCAPYLASLYSTTDVLAVCEEASKALSEDWLYTSVIKSLAREIKTLLAKDTEA